MLVYNCKGVEHRGSQGTADVLSSKAEHAVSLLTTTDAFSASRRPETQIEGCQAIGGEKIKLSKCPSEVGSVLSLSLSSLTPLISETSLLPVVGES